MTGQHNPVIISNLRMLSKASCTTAVLAGLIVLMGWAFKVDFLTNIIPGSPPMVPNTAFGFIMAGLAGWLLADETKSQQKLYIRRRVANLLAVLVLALGLLTFLEYLVDRNLGMDELLLQSLQLNHPSLYPGRPSPHTSLMFVIIGLALVLFKAKSVNGGRPEQLLAGIVFFLVLLVLSGHIYQITFLYAISLHTGMSLPTIAAFLALSLGLLFMRPDQGIIATFTNTSLGGIVLRRLLPAAIGIPIFLCWLLLLGEQAELYNLVPGVVFFAWLTVLVLTVVIWMNAHLLHRADLERKQAEGALHSAHNNLERRVSERTAELEKINQELKQEIAKRKHAQKALQLSEERYRLLAESALTGVYLIQDGLFRYVNPALAKIFGYKDEELIEKLGPLDLTIPEDREIVQKNINTRLRGKTFSIRYTFRGLRKDGSIINVEVHGVRIEQNRKPAVIGTLLDITEQTQFEEKLKRSEKQYRVLFNRNPQPMWVYDIDTLAFLDVNYSAVKYYGYTREEFLNMTIKDIHTREEIPALLNQLNQTNEIHQRFGIWRHKKKDGSIIEAEIITHELNFQGRQARLVLANDVTEQKKVEREREEILEREKTARAAAEVSKHRFSFLSDVSTILVSTLEYTKTLTDVAKLVVPQFADWCTVDILEADETLNRIAVAHNHPDKEKWARELFRQYPHTPDVPSNIYRVFRSGEPSRYSEITEEQLRALARDEEHFQLLRQASFKSVLLVPLVARDRTLGVLTFATAESDRRFNEEDEILAREIARRAAMAIDNARLFDEAQKINTELEERVAERTNQLETVIKELEAFSYSVSHDLRAPLRAIDGFSRILMEDYNQTLDEEGQRLLNIIRKNTANMGELINDLLELSRLGRKELRITTVNISELVNKAFEELAEIDNKRAIELNTGNLPDAFGDPALLKQVFANLISNAIKFTAPRDKAIIEIGGRNSGAETIYYVKDNGVGFDMKYADKLFGVFQRLHTTDEFEGTGVGLATVLRIINKHGGRIWAEGKLNEGATFYFALPANEEEIGIDST